MYMIFIYIYVCVCVRAKDELVGNILLWTPSH